jgi:dGTPase
LYTARDEERDHPAAGREGDEYEPYRTPYRRDYARLIHCPSFRRLQGKTQVFPPHESDFFRNRLTHSLEVAQIAKSIVARLNFEVELFKQNPINQDIVETAALAHDLGHPPFGHNGERALDDCLRQCGGFEGNAQTFRIVGKLEKKTAKLDTTRADWMDGADPRAGLNWTRRSLASIVKYDSIIPGYREPDAKMVKGIYECDQNLFDRVKKAVCPNLPAGTEFRTIEASIMDVADDIAYSTYDLEDALKSGFMDLFDILGAGEEVYERVASKVQKALAQPFKPSDVRKSLSELLAEHALRTPDENTSKELWGLLASKSVKKYSTDGYLRTGLTSELVGRFIRAVVVQINQELPVLSKVTLSEETLRQVECLKHFTFEVMIMSPRLRVAEARGYDVVKGIFDKLASPSGHLFMPDDCRSIYTMQATDGAKKRVIADFIAGMTDRYAVEFYGRLVSDNPVSIFKDF